MYTGTRESQTTVAAETSVSGIGLHTGCLSTLTFKPAPPDTGIVFRRVDLAGAPIIPATLDHVLNTSLRTAIGVGTAEVNTVEHVLAALVGLGIDNALVEVDAPETPGADGSALPFVKALRKAGLTEQDRPRRYYEILDPVRHRHEDALMTIEPSDGFRISMTISFDHPAIGTQLASFAITPEVFEREIAPARTFGFLCHMRSLMSQGIIQGVSLENSVVIGDEGVLNDDLRFPDEFVRHKILDLMGDLYLLGRPLRGHVTAAKTGHASHVAFSRRLRQQAARLPRLARPAKAIAVR